MNPVAFVIAYLTWHYGEGLRDVFRVWGNFLWFPIHMFSTGTLVMTLFSPWKRMQEDLPEKGHFDPEYWAGSILVNIIMRIVGFLVRVIFIAISLLAFAIVFVFGLVFVGFWFVAPVGIFVLFFSGLGFAAFL